MSDKQKAKTADEPVVERPSPMADDDTLKKFKEQGHLPERRRGVGTVRMYHGSGSKRTEMDVSTLDVEAHSRNGWKLASET